MEKVVTIHVYDNNSGDYLHCFDGSSSPVCNGEVLEFHINVSRKPLNL